MKRMLSLLVVAALTVSVVESSGIDKSPVGSAGGWANTIAAASQGETIYTVESGGALYATDAKSGEWRKLGNPDFAGTVFFFALGSQVVTIEKDGSLYLVNATDGSWTRSGKAGDWVNTVAGAVMEDRLYTIEASGVLYETDPASGTWKQIGGSEFGDTAFLFAAGDALVRLGKDGSLYRIHPPTGSQTRVGGEGAWKNTVAGAVIGGRLYTVEGGGGLYVTDPQSGEWKAVEGADFSGTAFAAAVGDRLYTIDGNGNLFVADVGGDVSAPSPESAVAAPPAASSSTAFEDEGENDPALAGQLTFKFMGSWTGDTDPFESDAEFQKQKEAAPDMVKALVAMMQGMKMSVTLDGITMEVMGEKVGPFRYSVLAAFAGNTMVIQNEEGPKQGVKSKIIFRDDKHIQVIESGTEGKAMFFKK